MDHENNCPCWECSAYPDNPPSKDDCEKCVHERCACADWGFKYFPVEAELDSI